MRIAKRIAALFGVLFFTLTAAAPAAFADSPSQIVVEDTAGVLYQPQLIPALQKLDFYVPTKVVIYTRNGDYSDNLNEEVLNYARSKHPEWLSADQQKWADGLFIFALDPQGRQVGTYFGEDRKVSLDQQEEIQEATKKLFREAQWTDGTVEGVKSAAGLIARPWYRAPALLWTVGIAGGVGVVGVGSWQLHRSSNRRKFAESMAEGGRSYTSVTLNLEVTELNASTIPSSSAYGSKVLERWHSFASRYRKLTESKTRLEAMEKPEQSGSEGVRLAAKYASDCAELDGLDDVIADSNALLNMSSTWQQAWQSQSGKLTMELDNMAEMLATGSTSGSAESRAALEAQAAQTRSSIEEWGAGLADGSLTPDQALDGLRDARSSLAGLLTQHSQTVIAANTKSQKEAELMSQKMKERQSEESNRLRRSSGSILDVSYPNLPFISIWSFQSGVDAGQSAVQSSRSSSSGSSTGYGHSGGSFSGSGSSSHF
ncbi:hypothetical protein FHU41_000064 [Psychromicrobium silvestre]|uniref:DUF5129 domain-containing protein n=1 Tax=Psychromicrobium silvestre TaxID=1645614 RepID=A0A7Y9S3G2_9MICC|nr:DUF5129 domain-containing protein [Psychromicrobium silvestre]NYE93843.1 hypothetical protein [Psychromicrobium silvestre]